jgi:hypothetical protein
VERSGTEVIGTAFNRSRSGSYDRDLDVRGYSANEGGVLTMAILDAEHALPGNEVTFVWREENGDTSKQSRLPERRADGSVAVRAGVACSDRSSAGP